MAKSTTKKKTGQSPRKSASGRNGAEITGKKTRKDSARSTGKQATKADKILALLQRSGGGTLAAIMKATGWQAHSVRGFISGHVVKKLGLRVKSARREGERCYEIAG